MNCPRCKEEITEKDLICPHCKKVLKLVCPICGNITKKPVCEKCGSVILNKCYKCGRLNTTNGENCPRCGMNINASIGLRESLIEEFAVLSIEITNFDEIKTALKSEKLIDRFKNNLYTLIKRTALQKKLRVQFIDDTFIIRFCKDYSFVESCQSALDFAIYVAQTMTEINQKLFDAKGVALRTQMSVQKRDVYSKPSEYKSGININVVYSSSAQSHLFNNIEVIVDSYIYQVTKIKYPYQSLSAVYIKDRMVMFFELILHKIIKLEKEKELESTVIKLPQNIDYEPEEDIDDEKLINFSGLNCTFVKAKNETLLSEIEKIKENTQQNPIISVKGNSRSGKLALVATEEIQKIYEDSKVVRFTCPIKNPYTPYGLIKQMLLAYKNMPEISVLTNQDEYFLDAITQDRNIQNLLNMQIKTQIHPEDLKYTYFESFVNFITGIPFKTLFVIEDFENADESSIEIIKYLVENKKLGNIGFLISCNENYSLHRHIYKLMTSNNYYEIELRPSSNKTIVKENIQKLKDIKDSFFIEKVLENTKGSAFYFNQAIEYLIDDKIIELKKENGKELYEIVKDRMIVIPKDLDELVQKRILHLQNIENALELFGSLLLIGEKIPVSIAHNMGIKDDFKLLKYLEKEKLIEIQQDKDIVIKNYNLYKANFIKASDKEKLQEIADFVLNKVFIFVNPVNNNKAEVLELAQYKKDAFAQWHSLAMISSQTGDFCAYLNCTNKFLSLVDNVLDPETDRTVEQVKMEVYAELASMLYKYYPDKIINFLEMLLTNLERQNDDQKIKEVANKLVQSCLISGSYNNALEYIGKIISRTQRSTFNPNDKDFNLNYFLVNLVTLEIYFNLGRLNECIELGDELFKYIELKPLVENVLPEGFSKKQFEDALLDALFFINASRIIQLTPDRKEKIEELIPKLPYPYKCFELLNLVNDFFEGKDIIPQMKQIAQEGLNDKYSTILFPILQGLISLKYQDWNNVGNYIYNAKIKAAELHLHQIEYFCDLMIGFAYQNLGNNKKAKQIFYNILDLSSEKGLKNLEYMSWYMIARLEFIEKSIDTAVGILDNSMIKMEKDANVSDIFLMKIKELYAQIILSTNASRIEQCVFCAEQAFEMAKRTKTYIYLPQMADMLMFMYNNLAQLPQSKENQIIIQQKIEQISRTMAEIF